MANQLSDDAKRTLSAMSETDRLKMNSDIASILSRDDLQNLTENGKSELSNSLMKMHLSCLSEEEKSLRSHLLTTEQHKKEIHNINAKQAMIRCAQEKQKQENLKCSETRQRKLLFIDTDQPWLSSKHTYLDFQKSVPVGSFPVLWSAAFKQPNKRMGFSFCNLDHRTVDCILIALFENVSDKLLDTFLGISLIEQMQRCWFFEVKDTQNDVD